MDNFSTSIVKLLDYRTLAELLSKSMIPDSTFVDLGSGDCSLNAILKERYAIPTIGVEVNPMRANQCRENGFSVILNDIRTVGAELADMGNLTLHAGFCLFNTFPLDDVSALIKSYFVYENIRELFFEIQDAEYFEKKYPPYLEHIKNVNGIRIVSSNVPFRILKERGVDLRIKYYSENKKLINQTDDRLYSHEITAVLRKIQLIKNIEPTLHRWPIRFDSEKKESHYYIHIRRT